MKSRTISLFCLMFVFCLQGLNAQSRKTKKLIKELVSIIKVNSIVSDKIEWVELSKQLESLAYTNKHNIDKEEVYNVFIDCLRNAGDNHSLFITEEVSSNIKSNQSEMVFSTSKILGTNVGYLKIPACISFNHQKDLLFSNTIINQIKELDRHTIDKWIIDLRDNRGGNVWPMLAGLTPIINDGLINYSIRKDGNKANFIKQGNIRFSKDSTEVYNTKLHYKKMAVLINNQTASSGEFLAISLLGYENSKSFGYKTSGLTTSNTTFYISDGSMLFLATHFMGDKNKKTYTDGVTPDLVFGVETSEDQLMKIVIDWLNE